VSRDFYSRLGRESKAGAREADRRSCARRGRDLRREDLPSTYNISAGFIETGEL